MDSFEQYIRDASDELHNIMEDVEFFELLHRSKKVKDGFTFLLPHDEYIKKLVDNYEADADACYENLKSLVVTKYLRSVSEWNAYSGQLSNLHNNNVEIKSITNKEIKLDGNTQATLLLGKQFSDKTQPISIFKVSSGYVSKGSTKAKKIKQTTNNVHVSYRRDLFNLIMSKQNIYMECLQLVASFLKFIATNNQDVFDAIVPFLDYCPITNFIILFEPSKRSCHFIDDNIINSWFVERTKLTNPKNIYNRCLSSAKNLTSSAYSSVASYKKIVQELRDDLQDIISPSEFITLVHSKYRDLCTKNQIIVDNTLNNVLPEASFAYIKSRCTPGYNIKLVQDEIRTDILSGLESGDSYSTVFRETCEDLNLYPKLMDMINMDTMPKTQFLTALYSFINTTHFMYLLPTTDGCYGGKPGYYGDVNPTIDTDDMSTLVIDVVKPKKDQLNNVKSNSISTQDVEETLNNFIESEVEISEQLLSSMKTIVRMNTKQQ